MNSRSKAVVSFILRRLRMSCVAEILSVFEGDKEAELACERYRQEYLLLKIWLTVYLPMFCTWNKLRDWIVETVGDLSLRRSSSKKITDNRIDIWKPTGQTMIDTPFIDLAIYFKNLDTVFYFFCSERCLPFIAFKHLLNILDKSTFFLFFFSGVNWVEN